MQTWFFWKRKNLQRFVKACVVENLEPYFAQFYLAVKYLFSLKWSLMLTINILAMSFRMRKNAYHKGEIMALSIFTVFEHTLFIIKCLFSDINECTTNSHSCDVNAVCQNTVGSHTCSCKAGYTGDGKTCDGKLLEKWKRKYQLKVLT